MPISVLTPANAIARADLVSRGFVSPLRPVLVGPRAGLHRYAVTAERASLGAYDSVDDQTYEYPDIAVGSVVDLASVKLIAADARLTYFTKSVGSNGTADVDTDYPNRVRLSNYVFTDENGGTRSAVFGDRDVKVGDVAKVWFGDEVVDTTVTGFIGEAVAATRSTAAAEANNKDAQSASATIEQVEDTPINDVVATVDGSAYDSAADGYITRTYTVTVTQAGVGGDATTARLRVRSADGGDDQDDVEPAAFGDPTAIGTKGLLVTWDIDTGNSSSSLFGIDEDDFVLGQQWTVVVNQVYVVPTATAAGTYTGTRDDKYIITVTRGGSYAGSVKPQITVTTANGSDRSGPTNVAAAATAYAVGSYGVTVAFNQTQLVKGDSWYVDVTAAAEGAQKTLVLADGVGDLGATNVNLSLSAARTSVEIPRGTDTWSRDADGLTVQAALTLTDPEFTDDGELVDVPLGSADLYVDYREWLTADVGDPIAVSSRAEIEALLGPVAPENPLAQAADFALQNTSGELAGDASRPNADTTDVVYCQPIGGDPTDQDLWTTALAALEENDNAYQIVPLTDDATVKTAVVTHVDDQSADTEGFYRVAWFAAKVAETAQLIGETTSTDDATVTATIAALPGSSPTKYTLVTASANGKFITNGVAAGDTLRINYGTDDLGADTYDEFEVLSVTSETVLTLRTGPTAAIAVARKIEVWHEATSAELVTALKAQAAGFASSRVRLVWPDEAGFGGTTYAGYNVCAALAGLAGSVPSNQGLRNVGLAGFDDVTRTTRRFTAKQVKDLAEHGVFVVSALSDGTVYVRGAGTTDPTDATTGEEMAVRNADMLLKAIQQAWAPYVGSGNVISTLQQSLEAALALLEGRLKALGNASPIGPPVGGLRLDSYAAVTGDPTKVDVTVIPAGVPVPLNQIRVRLPVTVG